jgi:hypothetical protein
VSQKQVETLAEAVHLAHLRPVGFDVVGLAMLRAADYPDVLSLHVCESRVDVAVAVAGHPALVRSMAREEGGGAVGAGRLPWLERTVRGVIAEAAALGLPAHAPLVMTGPSVTEDDIALIGGAVQRDVRPPHVPVAVRAPWELSRVAPALGVTLWGPEL